MQETQVWSLGQEDPMEKGMGIPSSVLGWRIPWTEEPGGLQSMGCQRVRQDWATFTHHPQKELTPELPSIWVQGPGWWAGRSSREPHRAESLRAVMEGRGRLLAKSSAMLSHPSEQGRQVKVWPGWPQNLGRYRSPPNPDPGWSASRDVSRLCFNCRGTWAWEKSASWSFQHNLGWDPYWGPHGEPNGIKYFSKILLLK